MSSEDFFEPLAVPATNSYEEKIADKFSQLYSLNVNDKVESKNGLTYLSWSWAWAEFKKISPTATYKIVKNPATNLPFFEDPKIGIIVYTEVSADGLTYEMWLPVMDASNHAMKSEPYTYQVWDKVSKKYVDRRVEAATMIDVNKTIMRSLVKNLAMFGLALYVYAGEDIPCECAISAKEPEQPAVKPKRQRKATDRYAGIKAAINATNDTQSLLLLYRQHETEINGNQDIKALFTQRKQEILSTPINVA
jgi:hypothetical protein